MISAAELVKGPRIPVEKPPLIKDDDLIKDLLRREIGEVKRKATGRIRLRALQGQNSYELFRMSGDEKDSELYDGQQKKTVGRVARGHMQKLASEVMKEFGWSDSPRPVSGLEHFNAQGIGNYIGGTSGEILRYPSATPGLEFERTREFYTDDPTKTIGVSWRVIDTAPSFRFRLRREESAPTTVFP